MRRACVFIDGSNFYHLVLKKLGIRESDFDFDAFSNFLIGLHKDTAGTSRHYSGVLTGIDFQKMSEAARDHHKTVRSLMSLDGWTVITTKLRTRNEAVVIDDRVENFLKIRQLGISEIRYSREREKAVDMNIGMDILMGALDDLYDIAILVSSDSDLVPVCDIARTRFWKRVDYVGFHISSHNSEDTTVPTKALIYATNSQRILQADDVRKFEKKLIKK